MGFATEDQVEHFLKIVPRFEEDMNYDGIILLKYWLEVSNEEQEKRFRSRIKNEHKQWKLSPMDLEARKKWVEYSRAKDEMFKYTDIKQAPWYVVDADGKKHARLNLISHLLSLFDDKDLTPEPIELPPRQEDIGYLRPPLSDQTFIPEVYGPDTPESPS